MTSLDRFVGKIVVVTGGAQGIGRATAERIASERGLVVIVDRAAEPAAQTVQELRAQGLDVHLVPADLASWSGASAAYEQIIDRWGRIDVLVNNVGGTIWIKPFVEYNEDEIRAEMDRSLWPTVWSCRAVIPHMIKNARGSIVNLGSNSVRGIYRIPYATAKGGVMSLTTSLAVELAQTGVRVNCVAPGGTDVPNRPVPRNTLEISDREVSWMAEMKSFVQHQMPMGRRGQVHEQAAAIAFFASDDASFITGQILSVAGGAAV
jgi:dihydroxycyclohexadiene carboxylate dehydrogenase